MTELSPVLPRHGTANAGGLVLVTTALVAAAGLAVQVSAPWSPAGAVFLVAAATLTVGHVGRSGARAIARTRLRRPHAPTAEPAAVAPSGRAAELRAVLAHVRVLEATLEEQSQRVTELAEELAAERARPQHDDVLRMVATVDGLRTTFGKDPTAERLLARIEAALQRLVGPAEAARVELPRAASPVATPEPQAVGAQAVGAQPAGAQAHPGVVEAPEAHPAEVERVLPVPATPVAPAASRRWRRR